MKNSKTARCQGLRDKGTGIWLLQLILRNDMTTASEIKAFLLEEYGYPASDIEVLEVTASSNVLLRCEDDDWCDAPRDIARLILERFGDINIVIDVDGLAFSRNTLKRIDDGR